jgi:hypothetical protein
MSPDKKWELAEMYVLNKIDDLQKEIALGDKRQEDNFRELFSRMGKVETCVAQQKVKMAIIMAVSSTALLGIIGSLVQSFVGGG